MKLFHFLLLNAACLLFLGPNLKANNLTSLSDAPETTYSCNLPAPANVQSNQPSATIADFSWNAVPGAWGYRGTLVNTSNGSSTMQVVTNNAASFSVTPGQTYVFHVVAACSATNYSDAAAEVNFKAEFIVIDLIAELNCPVDGREIKDTDPSTPDVWDFNWVIDQQYIIEFTKNGENGGNQQAWVGFKLNSMGHFEIRKLTEDPITAELCGLPIGSASGCQMAPSFPGMVVSCSNASFSCYNRKALMSLLSPSQLFFHQVNNPFDHIKIIEANCGGNFGGGGSGLSKPFSPELDASGLTLKTSLAASIVNPFAETLTVQFEGFPGENLQIRLLDLQGKIKLSTHLNPDELAENKFSLNTLSLSSGLYFLNLENEHGQVAVHKMVKI